MKTNLLTLAKGNKVIITVTTDTNPTPHTRTGVVENINKGGCLILKDDEKNGFRSFRHNRITECALLS